MIQVVAPHPATVYMHSSPGSGTISGTLKHNPTPYDPSCLVCIMMYYDEIVKISLKNKEDSYHLSFHFGVQCIIYCLLTF